VPLIRATIHQAEAKEQRGIGVIGLSSALSLLHENGFIPDLIVDVGANRGNWTLETSRVFPFASYILVDADPVNQVPLQGVCDSIPNSRFSIALLGPEHRDDMKFYQMGTGSSVLPERTQLSRNELTLAMTTLDSLVPSPSGRILLKLDVQGYELEVLRGASEILAKAEMVVLECSLIEYNDGAPLFAEVVAFMNERNFVVYDFCGQMRRADDGALFQVDVVFARKDSALRRPFSRWRELEKSSTTA
jgi:FkbM family methyltransferase